VIIAETQLFGGGTHAIGHVSVGTSGRNWEGARQYRTGQGNNNLVADHKVVGSTNNPAHCRGVRSVLGSHLHLTPANGLPIALRFIDEIEDFPDNDGAGDVEAVNLFFFEADRDQCLVDGFWSGVRLEFDVFAKPRQWNAH
jgi:hypothetical protein